MAGIKAGNTTGTRIVTYLILVFFPIRDGAARFRVVSTLWREWRNKNESI
jgi:hypothetical protein